MPVSRADPAAPFTDRLAVSDYADKARRLVPGWADLQKMAALLVAERAPEAAHVLVVGAGGGVELKPGGPFVMAHMSFPQASAERALWLSRYAAFAIASGVDPQAADHAASEISTRLPLLSPDEGKALLAEAGFTGTQLFYAGLAFRDWVTHA